MSDFGLKRSFKLNFKTSLKPKFI